MGTPNNQKGPTKQAIEKEKRAAEERDEANKRRFVDQSGLEASQLPDKGRPTGYNDTVVDIAKRNLPPQHGGEVLPGDRDDFTGRSEGGLAGDREIGDMEDKSSGGGRGKN